MTKVIKLKECEFLKVNEPVGSVRVDAKVIPDGDWRELAKACYEGELLNFKSEDVTFNGFVNSVYDENKEKVAHILISGKINLKD